LRRVRRADARRGDQSRGWRPTRRHKARLVAVGMRVWSSTREGGRSAAYPSEGGRRLRGGSAIQDRRRSGHRLGDRPGRDNARRRSQARERRLRDQGEKTDVTRLRKKPRECARGRADARGPPRSGRKNAPPQENRAQQEKPGAEKTAARVQNVVRKNVGGGGRGDD